MNYLRRLIVSGKAWPELKISFVTFSGEFRAVVLAKYFLIFKSFLPWGSICVFLWARQCFFLFLFSGEGKRGAFCRLLQVWP